MFSINLNKKKVHKPELIYFDQAQYERELSHFERSRQALQRVVDSYNAMGLEKLTTQELHQLFDNPHDVLYDKITKGHSISFGGLKIVKSKAYEIIEKPVGCKEFLKVLQTYIDDLSLPNPTMRSIDDDFFEMHDHKIRIIPAQVVRLEEQKKYYTKNQRQYDHLQALKKIQEGLSELATIGRWTIWSVEKPGNYLDQFFEKQGAAFGIKHASITELSPYSDEQ